MCLGIPGVVVEVHEYTAVVDFGGVKREVDRLLVPDVKPGDYVIVHAGAIISKLDPKEAEEVINTWKEVIEALET